MTRAPAAADVEVLARTWHWIGEAATAPIWPAVLLPGSLDEPLLFTRGAAGEARCLSNVCTHRGAILVDAPGRGKRIRCPYHGRLFDLDGRCLSQPGFPGAQGDLPRAAFADLGPMRFASLGDTPFSTFRAPLDARVLPYPVHDLTLEAQRDYHVAARWSLYVENYLEGLHIPYVHPALNAAIDARTYGVECLDGGVLQVGDARPDEPCLALPAAHPDHGRRVYAYYLWLWPTTMINVYPWGISLNAVQPLGAHRTRVCFRSYVRPGHAIPAGFAADLDLTEREDEAIVEAVQRGTRARLARPGGLAPGHEDGVAYFRRRYATG